MTKLAKIPAWKAPETYKVAQEQSTKQKPYKPTYTTDAYEKAIEYAAEGNPSVNTPDLNLRVEKAIKEQQTTVLPVTGENAWFAREVKQHSTPKVYHTVTVTCSGCTVTGAGQIEEGTTCNLVCTPTAHYSASATSWTNLPSSAVISSDYKTVAFTVDQDYTDITCVCTEDQKYTLTFNNDGHCTCDPASYEGYLNDQTMVTVTANAHYAFSSWDDGETGNPRIFTVSADATYTAQCTQLSQHTLTFTAVNGTVDTPSFTGYEGDTVAVVATGDTGCTWVSWSDGGTDQSRTFTVDTEDKTYTATYNQIGQYTLSFLTTVGGSVSQSSFTGAPGETTSVTCTPESHYTFSKWSDNDTSNPRTFTIESADETFTAEFAEDPTYTMSLSYTNGSVVVKNSSGTVVPAPWQGYAGDTFEVTFTPSEHYHFDSWTDGNTDNPRTITLNATSNAYEVNGVEDTKYTLTFTNSTPTLGSLDQTTFTGYVGDTVTVTGTVISTSTLKTHWKHWLKSGVEYATTNPTIFTITSENVEYTAVFEEDTKYTLTFLVDVAGTGSLDQTTFTGYAGDTVTVTATPTRTTTEKYHFDGWDDGITDNPRTFTVSADATHTAFFTEDTKYTLTFSAGTGGTVDTPSFTGYEGDTVSVTATASSGYSFSKWDDNNTDNPRTFTVRTAAVTYTAQFVAATKYTITCRAFPSDYGYLELGAQSGETVTLTGVTGTTGSVLAVPNSGYEFSYWTDSTSQYTENPHTITVGTENESVTAMFGEITTFIDFEMDEDHGEIIGELGLPVSYISGPIGDTETVTAQPYTGYKLSKWIDSSVESSDNPKTFTFGDSDRTVKVVWEKTYTLTFNNDGNGHVEDSSGTTITSYTGAAGSTVTVTAVPNSGYAFSKWNDDVTTASRTITLSADATYTANFEVSTGYTLTFNAVNGTCNPPSYTGYPGSTVEVTVTPTLTYDLTSWDDGDTNKVKTFTVGSSSAVYTATCNDRNLVFTGFTYVSDVCYIGNSSSKLQVSTDLYTWTTLTNRYLVAEGATAYVRGTAGTSAPGSITGTFDKVEGPVMALINYQDITVSMPDSGFSNLFNGITTLTDASALTLPTVVTSQGMKYMFANCGVLTAPPDLSGITTLNDSCFAYMFQKCSVLNTLPTLPGSSVNLADSCYNYMFSECTAITSIPSNYLPCENIAEECYAYMFNGCTGLTDISTLQLPATTLQEKCYRGMFAKCSNLENAALTLPAGDPSGAVVGSLAPYCYATMFGTCKNLTYPPALPATTLANYCYMSMFQGCCNSSTKKGLVTAPTLPAQNILNVTNCYNMMFYGCAFLTYIATGVTSSISNTTNWVNGVASSGEFHCVAGSPWTTGTGGIPSGWTKIEDQ